MSSALDQARQSLGLTGTSSPLNQARINMGLTQTSTPATTSAPSFWSSLLQGAKSGVQAGIGLVQRLYPQVSQPAIDFTKKVIAGGLPAGFSSTPAPSLTDAISQAYHRGLNTLAPTTPPEIKNLYEKKYRGGGLTPQEDKTLTDWEVNKFAPMAAIANVGNLESGASKISLDIAKSVNPTEIYNILKQEVPNIATDIAKQSSKLLAKMKNPAEVETVLNRLKFKFQGSPGFTPGTTESPALLEARKSLGLTEPSITATPSVESPLLQEARKYKSAEEFVNSQNLVYRASDKPFDPKLMKQDGYTPGTYFTKDKAFAEEYGKGTRPVEELVIDSNAKILRYEDLPANLKKNPKLTENTALESKKIFDYAKENGYDAVISENKAYNGRGDEITLINPKVVKTKSQLTDIWNKANQADVIKQATEARKAQLIKDGFTVPTNTEDIVQSIAKAKDPTEIANLLDSGTSVDKAQIPQLSKVLAKTDNPRTVTKLIEGFDTTRAPRKQPTLPPDLEQKKVDLELTKMMLDEHPAKPLLKYVSPTTGQLPEVTGKDTMGSLASDGKKTVKNSTFGLKGDQIITEYGYQTPEDAQRAIDEYKKQQKRFEQARAELKKEIVDYKKSPIPTVESKPAPLQGSQGEVKSIELQAKQARSILEGEDVPIDVSLEKIISDTITPVEKKVHIIDTYLRTPNRVMEKIGFGKEAKELRTAADNYWKELPKNIEKIQKWAKEVPKSSNERIFKFLDGQAITLTPEEQNVATEIRTWLQEWADRLGLKQDQRVTDYITRIFDQELIKKEFDENLAKIITDKLPGSVYNPFTLRRLGAKGYKEDTWAALSAYVKRGTRKVWMDPVLEKIQAKAGASLDMSYIEKTQWQFIKKYIDNINMRPSELDESIDNFIKSFAGYRFGQRPITGALKFLRQATFRGMLGLNPGSALRNISQGINTYAVLGEKYTTIGYLNLLKKGSMDELKREGILNAGFIQDKVLSATGKAMEKADEVLFSLFDMAEKINRGSAYFGAKSKAIAEGKTEEQAIEYAKDIVRKTQFVFDTVDTPVGMSSDIIKTLSQFQTFTTKQIEFLVEMAKDKNFVGLLRYAVAGLVFVYTIGQAFGMKPTELLPIYRLGVPPSLKFPWEVGSALFNAPDKYGNTRSLSKKASDIGNALIGLIPAGSQIKKTYQGTESVLRGGSYDKAGRKQFSQGESLADKIQSVLFGKYASQNAQDYFDKKPTEISKLTDEQNKANDELKQKARDAVAKIQSLSIDKRAEYIATIPKEVQKVIVDAIKKSVTEGSMTPEELQLSKASTNVQVKYVVQKMQKLNPEDRNTFMKNLQDKGVLNKNFMEELYKVVQQQ